MKVWFTSDTHFQHSNICKGTTSWSGDHSSCRDFQTTEEMDEAIITAWNKYVGPGDIVYHLGDLVFGYKKKIKNIMSRLMYKEFHFIYGNHDLDWMLKPHNQWIFDLFTSHGHGKLIFLDDTRFVLSHYAMRVWDKSHKGSIQLHGHSHANLENPDMGASHPINQFYNNLKTMDVGVDNAFRLFGEYRPFSLDEVMDIMAERDVAQGLDHHHPSNPN